MRVAVIVFLCGVAGLGGCSKKKGDTTPVANKPTTGDRDKKPSEPIATEISPGEGDGTPPRDPIYFDFDAYTVREDARNVLQTYADYLTKNAKASITISGHTDDRGTTEYNLALGDQRAKAARDYLVRMGIDPSRIKIISFGEERPATEGATEESWSRNRRDEFSTSTTR